MSPPARLTALLLVVTVASSAAAGLAAPGSALDSPFPELTRRLEALTGASQSADAVAARADERRDAVANDLKDASDRQARADTLLAELDRAAADALVQLTAAKARLIDVVRRTYIGRSGGADVLAGLLDSSSAAEFGRREVLARRVGDHEQQQAQEFRAARDRAQRAVRDAREARDRIRREVARLRAELPGAQQAADEAEHEAARARFDLDRWASVRNGPDTPIMGVSRLTASDLARWFAAQRLSARLTVPMDELARLFVEEGDAAGVRGDLAFAQSILETGSFSFPDYGQVHPGDNNFAGIGACDSCPSGRQYPDARTGVRAQMQLLRAYADRSLSAASLGNPPVDPALLGFSLRGAAPTWAGLTGKWATSTTYGDSIFSTYLRILGWVTDHPDPSATGRPGSE